MNKYFATLWRVFVGSILTSGATLAHAQSRVTFIPNTFNLMGMSADGKTLVGSANYKPAAWNASEGVYLLPQEDSSYSGYAYDANYNGSIIVGTDRGNGAYWANRVLHKNTSMDQVNAVSNEGNSFAGTTWTNFSIVSSGPNGLIFHQASNSLYNGFGATGISGDGNVVTGVQAGNKPFAWVIPSNTWLNLDLSGSTYGQGIAYAATFSGNAVYGYDMFPIHGTHYYWYEFLSKKRIAELSAPKYCAVADDNSIATAEDIVYLPPSDRVLTLAAFLAEQGLDSTFAGLTNIKVRSISGNGMVLAGTATGTSASNWIATLRPVGKSDIFKIVPNTVNTFAPGSLQANDTFGRDSSTVLVTSPTHGVLSLNADGGFDYTPEHNYLGRDSFTYRLTRADRVSDPTTVVLKIGVPESLTLTPTLVRTGSGGTGNVKLNFVAFQPTVVALKVTKPNLVTLPTTVTVPTGQSSATFAFNTLATDLTVNTTVSATLSEVSATAGLTVGGTYPTAIELPPYVVRDKTAIGTVHLWKATPAAGLDCTLVSSDPASAVVNSKFHVPGGVDSFNIAVAAQHVLTARDVTVTVTLNAISLTKTINVRPPALKSISLPSNSARSGNLVKVVVTTDTLDTAEYKFKLQGTVFTIYAPANSAEVYYRCSVTGETKTETITVSGYSDASSFSTDVTVLPAAISGVTFFPNPVNGGLPTKGTVLFDGVPISGDRVTYASATPDILAAPATTVFPTVTFSVTPRPVSASTTAKLYAKYRGKTVSSILNVYPASLFTVSVEGYVVAGGDSAQLRIRLKGLAGPEGETVSLASSDPSIVQVPATAFVEPGMSLRYVTITTKPVASQKSVLITGRLRTLTAGYDLVVNPK